MKLIQPPQSALANKLLTSLLGKKDNDTAFYFGDHEHSWQKVKTLIRALDQHLSSQQLGYHSRIAFIARSRPAHISCLWGLLITDRCASMIHCYQSTRKIVNDIGKEAYPVILADAQDWNEELIAASQEMNCLGIAITDDQLVIKHAPAITKKSINSGYQADDNTTVIETLSSGTTGSPKRIQLSRGNLSASTNAAVQALTQMNASASTPSPIISVLPLSNISGVYASTPALAMGMPMAILEKFQLDDWLKIVQRFKPVTADVPPAALAALYQRKLPAEVFNSIKVIRTGAAPLDRTVHAYFQNELNIPINLSYGASEFCGVITSWTMDDLAKFSNAKMGSCGRALPGVDLRITDPDTGEQLAPNCVGRLEAKVERVGQEWIATSDQAKLDQDGFMWFEGRLEETIFRGGFKLSPLLIAEQLRAHQSIVDAAVVGVDDTRLGQIPVAAIVFETDQPKPTKEELIKFCKQRLSAPEIPSEFYSLEELPRTTSYKVSLLDLNRTITELRKND